jgi:hypothetical protein
LRFRDDPQRLLNTLALVNASIWVISMIALIILMQDAPAVKKLAPILMAGTGAGVAVLSAISRMKP